MGKLRQQLKAQKATITYRDNGVQKSLFKLSREATLVAIHVQVKTNFDDSGTDNLKIGTTDNDDRFVATCALGSAGYFVQSLLDGGELGATGPVVEFTATYVGQNSNASQGEAVVIAVYFDPFVNP